MSEPTDPLETVFAAALDAPSPAARAALLDRACRDNDPLRERVEALLRAHDRAGTFLDSPATTASTRQATPGEEPGDRVGPYMLRQQIGEGGMGVVFIAEQNDPVRRRVALKIIKPGMDSRQVLARFDVERRALALMDHPNIARVLDAGATPTGRPYFVMELVQGVPITQFCDDGRLTLRQRLELFVPVCHAIQHAHQKGIIHRDIKASNVLVTMYDDRPTPKVIDFGLAKALESASGRLTDQTLVTGLGIMVGTLEYMSPEQAEFNAQDVDTRADIYSLGALLYELITGSTPLARERLKHLAVTEVLHMIREEEPPGPSTRISESHGSLAGLSAERKLERARLTREVRGELDWIVMKCLEKDRTRRYETASGLARDIQRYLRDEPVEASPPSTLYRLRKLARKNWRLIGAAAAFVLLLAVGAGVSAWQAVRARAAEGNAISALDREAEQARQARRSEARSAAVLKFFQDKVLAAARPKGQEGGLRRDATIREALDQAEPEIASAFAGEPLVEATIRNTLGVSYWYLGALDQARRQQERALALRRQMLGRGHPETVGALNDLAIVLQMQGKNDEAQKLLEEVVEVKRRTLGPEDPSTLRSVSNLATMMALEGLLEEALKLAQETLEIQRRVDGPEKIVTLRSEYNVATMRRYLGHLDEARTSLENTIHTLVRAFGPEHQDTLRAEVCLGELLLDQGEPDEARKLFEKVLEAQGRVLGATNDETIVTMTNLAETLRVQGRLVEARKLAEAALEQHRRILGPEHPMTLVALGVLASVERDSGRLAEAKTGYEHALDAMRRILSPRTPELQKTMNAYAWMLAMASDQSFRDPRRALELAQEIVRITPTPRIREVWTTLAAAHYRAGDGKAAIAAIETSEVRAPGRFAAANGFILAMAYWQLGEKEKARDAYALAVQSMEKSKGLAEPELASLRREAGQLLGASAPTISPKGDDKSDQSRQSHRPSIDSVGPRRRPQPGLHVAKPPPAVGQEERRALSEIPQPGLQESTDTRSVR
jgi:serine/threonine protein kinase